ncbi:AraC family transcriptional regulator [Oceanospirillum sediminis]|uniref:AraC family transcriptional regulator n=1 Tax=Oceanospirillum sediminis TaxID=2760088 RepID=A0A839ISE8_9GAMM|nr:AraC family transcriptional regulator [Oceanospirillum sediminis]MBB1487584.1 AraC family transcriptional regulator [Oceanospirillum sediminis]
MPDKLHLLNQRLIRLAQIDGFNSIGIECAGVFRASEVHEKVPAFYEPLVCLVGQGVKHCHVGDKTFCYQAGDFFINFLPMPVTSEIVRADAHKPFLSAALSINLVRLADMVLRIERFKGDIKADQADPASCVVVAQADDELIDVFTRLLSVAEKPLEADILGEAIVDEIYYRLLTSKHGYALRSLLNQYGQIQPISRVVSYIHDNMDRNIQVHELASIANMSKTAFFGAFKKLMHVPPMQYIKSTRLQKAQALLVQGMQANEASYRVGYNSFSQFSREYKRFFGFPPSETRYA